MPDLVALALPPGPDFLRNMLEAWEVGDAIAPIDLRLPPPARAMLLDELAPSVVVSDGGTERRSGARPVSTGDALVIGTSGTTGRPRGVVLTHEALAAAAEITSEALEVDPANDRWLACLPFSHIGGLGVAIRAHLTGIPLDVLPKFDAADVQAAADAGATLVSLVPAALAAIDPGAFRRILLGGGRMPDRRPPSVVATYGLTESGGGVVFDGRPLAGIDVVIEKGQIMMRGPTLANRYRDGTPVPRDDGWLATGDRGEMDASGRLMVQGRIDDLITTGGETVAPDAIEDRLRQHVQVSDVAVVGVPDDSWGEVVTAVVVPTDRANPPDLGALRRWVKDTRPAYEAPHRLVLVDHLPRTAIGKVQRESARQQVNRDPEADG